MKANGERRLVPNWAAAFITLAGMALLIFIVWRFHVPNPNMILIAGLVICPDLERADFEARLRAVTENRPTVETDDGALDIGYSVG